MRNYFKFRGGWVVVTFAGAPAGEIVAFDKDDETLMVRLQSLRTKFLEDNGPGFVFRFNAPQTLWVKLDEANMLVLLNPVVNGQLFARFVWENSRLKIPNGATTADPGDKFVGITQVESEKSPRKTWSRGH